jgi:hypothetical protein
VSQRDGLRKAVIIAAIAAAVIVVALVTMLGIMAYGAYHHAVHAIGSVLPPPAVPAHAGVSRIPPAVIIGIAVLIVAGLIFRLKRR